MRVLSRRARLFWTHCLLKSSINFTKSYNHYKVIVTQTTVGVAAQNVHLIAFQSTDQRNHHLLVSTYY